MTYVFSPSEQQRLMCAAFVFCVFAVAAVAAHLALNGRRGDDR